MGILLSSKHPPSTVPQSKLSTQLAAPAVPTSSPPIPSSICCNVTSLSTSTCQSDTTFMLSNPMHTFRSSPFRTSQQHDTHGQLLFKIHFFSRLPATTTSSPVTSPQTPYALATPTCSPAPGPSFHASVVLYILFLLPGMSSCSSKIPICLT